ncbi:MAG: ParB/RepB/Spo0J family partition protein [bacterium]|nr:ParB/RepB/Spo0J family partition protein [bacterium]
MDEKINEKRKESVFWIELERIVPNPYQPRREFEEGALKDLAESIREYGVLQPIVVTRKEKIGSEVGSRLAVEYELLAGERRLRAAKLIGLAQIPVIIRDDTSNKVKLELALVENLQREDLNPMEKARAFKKLIDEFGMLQREVAEKIGKSREVVANTLRLLTLPVEMQQAVAEGKISEGHTRPLLMLTDHPEDQKQLYSNILTSNLSVREAEKAARNIAVERARAALDPETKTLQQKMENALGTRVHIERKAKGNSGKILIEFFSEEELRSISDKIMPPAALMS